MENERQASLPLKGDKTIHFDDALRLYLGEFGPFTRRMVALICFELIFTSFHIMGPVFFVAVPGFWCTPPGVENIGKCSRFLLDNITVPWTESDGSLKSDHCLYYERNYSSSNSSSEGCSGTIWGSDNDTIGTCLSWEYDRSQLGDTMAVEWNFVCSRAWMASTVTAVFLGGRALGNLIFGWLADRFGRKKVIFGTGVFNVVAGVAGAAAPNYVFFLFVRFIHGALVNGKSNAGFVCALEFSGPSWRVYSATIHSIAWACSCMLLSGIAYLLRYQSWRVLLIVLTIPEIIYYPLVYFYMPESPRWLYLREQNEEAEKVLNYIAKINKKTLPKDIHVVERKDVSSRTPWDLIRTPRIRLLTFILAYLWAANGFIYYGLALNTGNLGGNTYINFIISGAIEIPAYISIIVAFNRWGRIWPFSISMLLGGIAMLLIATVPHGTVWPVVSLAMTGRFFICVSFGIIWIYSTEVYPTCIRNIGVTVTGVTARLSSPISPYIALLGDTNKALPYIIFGALSMIAGMLVLFLPETRDVRMPQTIQDGEELIRDNRINVMCWKTKNKLPPVSSAEKNGTPMDEFKLSV